MPPTFESAVPVLRIFAPDKAREFYVGFLGFRIDWEYRFASDLPLYMQVSRGKLAFHLTEHHGDGSPGAGVFVRMKGLADFHREISDKDYPFLRPAVASAPWNADTLMMTLTDPFSNRITFVEEPA